MIKSLSYEQLNEIESHFLFAGEDRLRVQELTADIAESSSYALEPTGVHGTKLTDITAEKAIKVEKETKELRAW